jgi:ankyrin repeat protein/chitinase
LLHRFLLARLHTKSLASCINSRAVHEALKSLSRTLEDTYASTLDRINKLPDGIPHFSFKVLCWVAYSFRPLTVNELCCALAIDPGDPDFDGEKIPLKEDISNLCAGLVVVDHISDVVRLVHPTLQTYFNMDSVRKDPRFSEVLAKMAEICLNCLSFCRSGGPDGSDDDGSHSPTSPSSPQRVSFNADPHDSDHDGSHSPRSLTASISPPPKANPYDSSSETDPDQPGDAGDDYSEAGPGKSDDLFRYALKDYAVRYWGEHARRDSEQSENCSTTLCAIDFLCDDAKREDLVSYMWEIDTYATYSNVTELHIAAKFGLAALAKALLAKHLDKDVRDGAGNSALAIAIESGHEEVVDLLVKAGVSIDLLGPSGQTILIILVEMGFKDVAKQILQKAEQTPQIALLAAAYEGRNTELAQILQNPDLDLKDKHELFGVTALLVATECGNYEVIKALLKHGVDVNARGGGATSPALHRATCHGDVKIVKLLLANNATIDLRDGEGKTAWACSVVKHQREISNLLRKAGADPNTKGALGVSELYNAANGHRLEDVRFLLESGTDPSIQTIYGWAPLHWVSAHGNYDIVKLLLKYGAKPSPVSDQNVTPLDLARSNGQWKVVELLEKAGATSARNAQGRLYELEDLEDSATLEGNEGPEGLRIVCYHQTHHLQNGDFVSLLPLITEATGATHVILAAIHLDEGPGNIHLNDDRPSDPKFAALWKEVLALQNTGIKVLGMLGGASAGSFMRLNSLEFEAYYTPLKDMITAHSLDGLDLDVEEEMPLDGIIQLIDRLKNDFGDDFLITLAPIAAALYGSENLSGFDYRSLEAARGDKIAWYNAQFYCGWGSMEDTEHYDAIIKRGWPASKVVVGLVTNPANGIGWVSQGVLETTLTELKKKYPDFGGVMGWEYFNSLPGDEERPWEWAAFIGRILKTSETPDTEG